MISITIPNIEKPRTVKDAIISTLASEWPLTARKVYNKIRSIGLEVSYQAVHKAIKELLLDNVLEKDKNGYKLSIKWIERIEEFGQTLRRSYENDEIPTIDKIASKEVTYIQFDTLYRCYLFIVDVLFDATKYYNKIGIAQLYHLYWALGSSDKIFNKFKNMLLAYEKIYAVTPSKTAVDRMIAKFYKKIAKHTNIKLGIDCAKDFDVFVTGNFVIQIFYDEKTKRMLHQSYLKTKVLEALGLSKLYEMIFNLKVEINVVILKNPTLAEQIRKQTINYFEK